MLSFSQCFGRNNSIDPVPVLASATTIFRGSLSSFLQYNLKGIHRVEIIGPAEASKKTAIDIFRLFPALDKNPQIKELSLTNCYTNRAADEIVAEGIANNTTLEVLEVHHDRMSESGVRLILEALAINHGLKKFMLDTHTIYDNSYKFNRETIPGLVNVLKFNKSLTAIDLTFCHIERNDLPALTSVYRTLSNRKIASITFGIYTLSLENVQNNTLVKSSRSPGWH